MSEIFCCKGLKVCVHQTAKDMDFDDVCLGMFIFAELMAQYLENLPNRDLLIEELKPDRFPVKLDAV